jgi:hypothetical protein
MATTELSQELDGGVNTPWLPQSTERRSVRMNWVVVTDANGNRRLKMSWHTDRAD